ncbi:hypothetical protein PhCBS80983_g06022 [Powellomyces hirtus]|uniref:Uncharacterized protein n=1 Tax=Powellomyces hirtus TaxID=109895 RepID=A0A507DSB3_9FUNG|nr:hypothetical protein PhCBS80983_g06022 [Powellomyces hirtus]
MSSSSSYIPRPRAHPNPPSSARRRNGDQQQLQQRPRSAAYDSLTPSGPSLLQPPSGPTMASSSANNSTYNYSSRRPIAESPMARSRQNFDHSHHQYQYTTPPPPSMPVPSAVPAAASHHHPQFRSKMVCTLSCRHCTNVVCSRGMKAILLGDLRVELYSTDSPPAK